MFDKWGGWGGGCVRQMAQIVSLLCHLPISVLQYPICQAARDKDDDAGGRIPFGSNMIIMRESMFSFISMCKIENNIWLMKLLYIELVWLMKLP